MRGWTECPLCGGSGSFFDVSGRRWWWPFRRCVVCHLKAPQRVRRPRAEVAPETPAQADYRTLAEVAWGSSVLPPKEWWVPFCQTCGDAGWTAEACASYARAFVDAPPMTGIPPFPMGTEHGEGRGADGPYAGPCGDPYGTRP